MLSSLLRNFLQDLPPRHRSALAWFDDHARQIVSWPGQLTDGTLPATKAKGIYKPEWTKYALSVRQSINGPYPDKAIQSGDNGTWTFEYYQEGLDEGSFESNYTNRGLVE